MVFDGLGVERLLELLVERMEYHEDDVVCQVRILTSVLPPAILPILTIHITGRIPPREPRERLPRTNRLPAHIKPPPNLPPKLPL